MTDPPKMTGQTTERLKDGAAASARRPELALAWVLDSAPTQFIVLHGGRLTIGRSRESDLCLDHQSVSREHAELYRQGPTYSVRDLESTNGTWLDGERVEHAALQLGNVLRFGHCVAIVMSVEQPAQLEFASLAPGLWGGPTLAGSLEQVKTAAATDVPVVLVGETGTGKERIARALHHWSGRSGPLCAINCSALPASLAEAELFGHERGAFTSAERARNGHFQAAHGGTLLLDEISDLPLEVQAKLLRVVETGEVVPLGGTLPTRVDVRIIATAHERLESLVEKKRFRVDLAARLTGFVVEVPPLRSRREEIPGLFSMFLEKYASGRIPRVSPELMEWLCLRSWPGNVRELELLVRKLLALHAEEPALRLNFAEALCGAATSRTRPDPDDAPVSATQRTFRDRRENDFHRLKLALEQTEGNLKAAAESIGISRRRAYRLLEAAKRENER